MRHRRHVAALCLLLTLFSGGAAAADYLNRPFIDDTLYFLVLDRFAKDGPADPKLPAVDPANARMFHGGNLKAAAAKLDYIKKLGATAIWVTPIFVNQSLQGNSAGYHGYWILDFLHIDPHFGTEADFQEFVEQAHRRDIKVFLDIVVNHTADVIQYRECPLAQPISADKEIADRFCPYRSKALFPYDRSADGGKPINDGFLGDDAQQQNAENFARLTDLTYAYHPYIPTGREHAKNPDWLNDLRYYHNRGTTTFKGESALDGDFGGLDDVFTEDPRVLQGFIEIYRYWIKRFKIDGYRVDTARHVNVEFWQSFIPQILDFAKAEGIPNFFIFGEVADFSEDSVMLARFTREAKFPGVLDFSFFSGVAKMMAGKTDAASFAHIFQADSLYAGGAAGAATTPIFISNHDNGRLAYLIRKNNPELGQDELMRRVILGHALMMFSRGVPILYYGDEQGLIGGGDDAEARQDMFASQVAAFQTEEHLGPATAPGRDHFDVDHPLFLAIAEMAALRRDHPGLRHGDFRVRETAAKSQVVTFSKIDRAGRSEYVVAANLGHDPQDVAMVVEAGSRNWQSLHGSCTAISGSALAYETKIPPLDYTVCRHDI